MVDIKATQLDATGSDYVARDIDKISVNIFDADNCCGCPTGGYCHNVGTAKGRTVHKDFETARNNSDRGSWTGDFLPTVAYKDLSNGVFIKRSEPIGKSDKFSKLGLPLKSAQWTKKFNEPEVPNFGVEYHNDVSMERHVFEVTDLPDQKFDATYAKTNTSFKSKAAPNLMYDVNDNLVKKVKAKALVVYPWDYRNGYITHGTEQSTDVNWKDEVGWIPVEPSFNSMLEGGIKSGNQLITQAYKPIPGIQQSETVGIEWLLTNVPNNKRTFDQAGMGKYPSLRNYKDFAYLFDQDDDTSLPNIQSIKKGKIDQEHSLRMWPLLQPFSGEKSMHLCISISTRFHKEQVKEMFGFNLKSKCSMNVLLAKLKTHWTRWKVKDLSRPKI